VFVYKVKHSRNKAPKNKQYPNINLKMTETALSIEILVIYYYLIFGACHLWFFTFIIVL